MLGKPIDIAVEVGTKIEFWNICVAKDRDTFHQIILNYVIRNHIEIPVLER